MERKLFSQREWSAKKSSIDLRDACRIFAKIFEKLDEQGYFHICSTHINSRYSDFEDWVLLRTGKKHLIPVEPNHYLYSKDDLFDLVELLHDCVCAPPSSNSMIAQYRRGSNRPFSSEEELRYYKKSGQDEYRQRVNYMLSKYESGYTLSEKGEILELSPDGLQILLENVAESFEPNDEQARIDQAIRLFQHRPTVENKRDALRNLGDVYEMRKKQGRLPALNKDDTGAIGNFLNNCGIRHHNGRQKNDLDPIYLDWAFYALLAALHANESLLHKERLIEAENG